MKRIILFALFSFLPSSLPLFGQQTHWAINDDGEHEVGLQLGVNETCMPPFFRSGGISSALIGDESGGPSESDFVVLSFDALSWSASDEYVLFLEEQLRINTPFADLGDIRLEITDSSQPFPNGSNKAVGAIPLVATLSEELLLNEGGVDLTAAIQNLLINAHERYIFLRLRFETCTDGDGNPDLLRLEAGGESNPKSPRIVQSSGSGGLNQKLYFAQFADGALGAIILSSQVVLVNPSNLTTASVDVNLQTDSGGSMTVDLNGEQVSGVKSLMIPPGGVVVLSTDGMGAVQRGSVVVCSDIPLFGTVLFAGSVGFAGVGSSSATTHAVTPVQVNAAEASNTGMAIMSLGDEVSLQLSLKDASGAEVAKAELQLNGNAQDSRYADQYAWDQVVDFSNFVGTIEVTGDTEFAAIVILVRPNQFATLPLRRLDAGS